MSRKISLRVLTPEERRAVEDLALSRTAEARTVERARIILAAADGLNPSDAARQTGLSRPTIYPRIKRFNAQGPYGLRDQPRSGRPAIYPPEQVAEVLAAALADPRPWACPSAPGRSTACAP